VSEIDVPRNGRLERVTGIDGQIAPAPDDLAAFAGLASGMAAWAIIGTAMGRSSVTRSLPSSADWYGSSQSRTRPAGSSEKAARFTPGQGVHALADVTQASNLSFLPFAVATLMAYLVAGIALATVTFERRDLI
jgi:hypothetical protein